MYQWILVIAQFLLAAYLVLSATWLPIPLAAILGAMPGIILAIWAWLTVGLTKLRIHPDATDSTKLIVTGPFGIVRHPMYAGLLWFTAFLLSSPFGWIRLSAWLSLLIVLLAKTRIEERSMSRRFPEYESYRGQVGRLFPHFHYRASN